LRTATLPPLTGLLIFWIAELQIFRAYGAPLLDPAAKPILSPPEAKRRILQVFTLKIRKKRPFLRKRPVFP